MQSTVPHEAAPIQSAFLKADSFKQLPVIEAAEEIARQIPGGQLLKIRFEIDTDPPPGFETHTRNVLQPIPWPSGPKIFFGTSPAE